jgi:hypothetical protein
MTGVFCKQPFRLVTVERERLRRLPPRAEIDSNAQILSASAADHHATVARFKHIAHNRGPLNPRRDDMPQPSEFPGAFPSQGDKRLSIHDYFAAPALSGMLTTPPSPSRPGHTLGLPSVRSRCASRPGGDQAAGPASTCEHAHQRNVTPIIGPPRSSFWIDLPDWPFQSRYRYRATTSPQPYA